VYQQAYPQQAGIQKVPEVQSAQNELKLRTAHSVQVIFKMQNKEF
jgi:hypothetical protein